MRKVILCLILLSVTGSLQAFENRLIGSWGLVKDNEKEIFITFSRDAVSLNGAVFGIGEYETADDTIYIEQNGSAITIQYYLLAANKLLFIMTYNEFTDSLILILTKI